MAVEDPLAGLGGREGEVVPLAGGDIDHVCGVRLCERVPVLGDDAEVCAVQALRSVSAVSYVLVDAQPGIGASELARRIDASVPGVTATTREAFARSERRVVGDGASMPRAPAASIRSITLNTWWGSY